MQKKTKVEPSYRRRGIRRGFDFVIVRDVPQRREHLRRVLETIFDEAFDLFVDTGASRFCCRVFHPDIRELVDV